MGARWSPSRLVPAPVNTHDSGGRRSPPGPTRRPVMCPGTLPVTGRSQPAPATTSDRTYLRAPVLVTRGQGHRARVGMAAGVDVAKPAHVAGDAVIAP